MGIYDKIASAPVYGGGNYILPGRYLFAVEDVRVIDSAKESVQYGIIACRIIETTNDVLKPGDTCSARIKSSSPSFASNMKNFCFAVGKACFDDFEEKDIDGEFAESVFEKWDEFLKASFEGDTFYIRCEAIQVQTKAGQPFTKLYWFAPDEEFGSRGVPSTEA